MKKFIVLSIVLLMIAGFAITSSANSVTLYADQIIDVGTLTVEVIDTNLVVTYNINASWVLGETHLYVGDSVPTKSAPGRFPYGPDDAVNGVYTIPLTDFGGVFPLYIAAQAEVTHLTEIDPDTDELREETAWADGTQIRLGKNWATYFPCAHSIYAFEYDVPPNIEAEVEYVVPVAFLATVVNCAGYGDVRFKFSATGPGDVTFTATDSQLNVITQLNEGYWGPASGFDLPANYWATTDWTLMFSLPGEYIITFSLIEAPDGNVVDGITGSQEVLVQ